MTIPYSKQQPPPINQLPNVNISESLADGEVLKYNEATEEWINGTAGASAGTEIVATDNLRSLTSGTGTPTGTGNILLGLNAGSANPASNGLVCIGMNALPVASTNISDTVVIGENAGLVSTRTNKNVLIGSEVVSSLNSTINNDTENGVVIGYDAGGSRIGNSVVIGSEANKSGYSVRSVIVGQDSARSTLAIDQVIIGANAKSLNGNANGDNTNVIIGNYGGERHTGASNVMIGSSAGQGTSNYSSQKATILGTDACKNSGGKDFITSLGHASGFNNAGVNATYIGKSAGLDGGNHANTIVLTAETGGLNPISANSFFVKPIRNITGVANALFYNATSGEITYDTAGGGGTEITATDNLRSLNAGTPSGNENILLGDNAGNSVGSGIANTIIGYDAGANTTGSRNILIGKQAGNGGGSRNKCVVIGISAMQFGSGTDCVAIGTTALYSPGTGSDECVAIGARAGVSGAGQFSVVIGSKASEGAKFDNTIVLNATGSAFNPTQASSCFIKPIRNLTNSNKLLYNSTSGEITYEPAIATQYALTSNLINPTAIFTNWATPTGTLQANLGTPVSVVGGVFAFPATGTYKIEMTIAVDNITGGNIRLNASNDNFSTQDIIAQVFAYDNGGSGIDCANTISTIVNITDIANDKVSVGPFGVSGTIRGGTADVRTSIMFIKLS